MAESLYELEGLSYRELVRRYDDVAKATEFGPAQYREELARRNVSRVNNLLLLFTAVVTIATIAALYITLVRS